MKLERPNKFSFNLLGLLFRVTDAILDNFIIPAGMRNVTKQVFPPQSERFSTCQVFLFTFKFQIYRVFPPQAVKLSTC